MILPYDTDFGPPVAMHPPREITTAPPKVTVWLRENPALVPEAVATGVLEEASAKRGKQLPREWAAELVHRADLHAQTNPRFSKLLRRPGDESRDWLWSFMRHWLESRNHSKAMSLNRGITADGSLDGKTACRR